MDYNRPPVPPSGQPDYENQQNEPFSEKPEHLETFDEAFKIEKPKYNDIAFAIFFLLVVAGFVAVAGITLHAMSQVYSQQGGSIYSSLSSFTLNSNTAILFGFVVVIAVVLSFLLILFARLHAKFFITTGLILNVLFGVGTAIYYFVAGYYSAAIVFLVFALLAAWFYWSCRSRIPFSATVLEITIDVMKRYKSTLVTSLIGIIVSGAFSALFSMVLVATYMKYSPDIGNPGCDIDGGSCSQSTLIGVLVFVFFAGYYISEVIRNIIHVTIAGVYGTWYYLANSDQGEPKYPALGAFKRAMTYCFGSICFGSLIVSIIQLIRGLVRILRNNAFGDGNVCAGCGFLILDFIIGIIEWMVKYFNHYAYIYIALYGKNYIASAKETFQLIRFKGMDALINDCFVNTSIQLYSLFVAYVNALFAYLYLKFTEPEYNSSGSYYAPIIAFTFLISGQITRVSLTVIESGISTFFVALARDPEVFQMTNRDRFDEIFRNYPQVLQKIFSKEEQQQMQQQQNQQNQPYYQQPAQYGRY
ncbi:protein PNS1 [Metschnikowia bicuspidata var. bicuspidata NRRL YB-4993]|uniref:Protein PNS1 n=1 Tax=Metschnikowia bicuspidata var. bicuspidata NRRL YB-4993 TaxID=869754 RepID=A0A1A0H518_9ASCO|nr:protein PNS1 [Metschnikowia bicuspidata var. bicuspidata NRRL YB-4993]OBA19131.1 protein PNS1 [Metschnikowia bicuspidata var. bicuspidata NRRL YB-4993]